MVDWSDWNIAIPAIRSIDIGIYIQQRGKHHEP